MFRLPRSISSCGRLGLVAFACVVLTLSNVVQAVHLRGQIVRVGYPGSSSDRLSAPGDVFRVGRYTPVLIELTNDDGDQFDGVVEVRQNDVDGDEVVASREISVRGTRRFNLYVPAGPLGDELSFRDHSSDGPMPFGVRVFDMQNRLARLFDDKGKVIKELIPPRQVVAASDEAVLILDASQRPVNQIDNLRKREGMRDFVLMRCAPKDLPEHVCGLEMVDIIVWDGADPSVVDSLQNDAILEWLRRGGTLIIGVSRNWNVVAASQWGPLLPARMTGTTTDDPTNSNVGEGVFKAILSEGDGKVDEEASKTSKRSLTYCPVTRLQLTADAVAVLPSSPGDGDQIWVARRTCGRGQIVLVTAEMRELLAIASHGDTLLRDDVLRLGVSLGPKESMSRFDRQRDVFGPVAAQTAFHAASGFYFAFAFAFVIAYIVVVTGASWGWLKRKNATRQAWVIFAGVAIVASAVSLGAVQIVRAIGQGVHALTIVDGRADSFEAMATSYLGMKTASHVTLDLCVPLKWHEPSQSPESRGSLRPLCSETQSRNQSTFSMPLRYEAVGPLGELREVPLRATLKQFETTWRGELTGRIRANLRHRIASDNELESTSWIENQLGTDLHDCYLFTRGRRNPAMLVYFVQEMADKQKIDVGSICRAMEDREKKRRASPSIVAIRERLRLKITDETWHWSPPVLREMLIGCLDEFSLAADRSLEEQSREQILLADPLAEYVPSLLLLTFYDDPLMPSLLRPESSPFRSQGYNLAMSSEIQAGTALFVGFSEDSGPLRLCRRKPGGEPDSWKAIQPSRSVVMYRMLVPVQR